MVVLEAGDDVGGRTLSVPVGGLPSNTGALFVYRGTPADDLREQFGIRVSAFEPETWGVHVNGTTVVDIDNTRVVDALPISDAAKRDLHVFIAAALEEYAGHATPEDAGDLATETIGSRLERLHPEAREILARAIQGGSVADPSRLSAQYALRYFASYLAHEKENRYYPLDGMQAIPRAIAATLPPGTIRFRTEVTRVARDRMTASYEVDIAGGAPLRARDVILAIPGPVTQRIVEGLPTEKRAAMDAATMPGSTTLCITADVSDAPHIARWAFVATVGTAFDCLINPRPAAAGENPCIVQFVGYGNSAGYRPELVDDPAAVDAWVEDFLAVAPELRGRILGAHLQTWEHCFAILTPEKSDALAQLQASVNGLHFAGDHTSPTAGTHGAYAEGRRAAEAVLARQLIGA